MLGTWYLTEKLSIVAFSHQDIPSLDGTIQQYQLPLIRATQLSNWVERDLSYNR
jgi:hypothetical protein